MSQHPQQFHPYQPQQPYYGARQQGYAPAPSPTPSGLKRFLAGVGKVFAVTFLVIHMTASALGWIYFLVPGVARNRGLRTFCGYFALFFIIGGIFYVGSGMINLYARLAESSTP